MHDVQRHYHNNNVSGPECKSGKKFEKKVISLCQVWQVHSVFKGWGVCILNVCMQPSNIQCLRPEAVPQCVEEAVCSLVLITFSCVDINITVNKVVYKKYTCAVWQEAISVNLFKQIQYYHIHSSNSEHRITYLQNIHWKCFASFDSSKRQLMCFLSTNCMDL